MQLSSVSAVISGLEQIVIVCSHICITYIPIVCMWALFTIFVLCVHICVRALCVCV